MIDAIEGIRAWKDRLLGRGDAAITVPVFDGALKANNLLEDAAVFATPLDPQDLATDGSSLFVADGASVLRYDLTAAPASAATSANVSVVHRFAHPVTALACVPGGGLAVALDGREVRIVGGLHDAQRWTEVAGQRLHAVNAISASSNGTLVVTDGSREHAASDWKRDLMTLGRTGRVLELSLHNGAGRELATGLAHAFGACAVGTAVWASESWRHRVMSFGGDSGDAREKAGTGAGADTRAVTDALPGYPSRITPASAQQGGGFWLTCFTLRTQLVEFVLREDGYRKRMVKEIAPAHWVAPALNSGNSFLEPMQGAQLKTMGVVKPWAPPRSYGLVLRLDGKGHVRYSLHSRFDGKHHGVTAAVECRGDLYVLAKGANRILKLSIDAAQRSLQA